MEIVINNDVLFFRVPKTGSSFVTRYLREHYETKKVGPRKGHLSLAHYDVRSYRFSFAFLRHPISWAESHWFHLSRSSRTKWRVPNWKRGGQWHPWELMIRCQAPTFAGWIDNICHREPGLFTRMAEWYCGPPGSDLLDYIGDTEFLTGGLHAALGLAGLESPGLEAIARRPKINVSNHSAEQWPHDLKTEFVKLEQPLIRRLFGIL